MIELKFIGDAAGLRAEMLALLGGPNVVDNTYRTAQAETLVADAMARAEGKNLDGSERRETTAVEQVQPVEKPKRGRRAAAQTIEGEVTSKTEQPNISARPEDRGDPATAAQDKADEAVDGPADNTVEGVRAQANAYISKFTFEHACVDLVPCLMKAAGVGTLKELTALNDPAKFEAATVAIRAAVASDTRYPTEG